MQQNNPGGCLNKKLLSYEYRSSHYKDPDPDSKVHGANMGPIWGQHGAHLGPVGPRWATCWPHEPCYQGLYIETGPDHKGMRQAIEKSDSTWKQQNYELINETQDKYNQNTRNKQTLERWNFFFSYTRDDLNNW